MMCKLKGRTDKKGHYDVEMKGYERVYAKRGHYDVQIKRGMDKGGHYDVEMKWWMQKHSITRCNLKRGRWIREGIMRLK